MRETRKRKKSGVLHRLRAKTQSKTIHLTQEDDWDTEVPNVRLSRVFSVVLLLHVVAVGGILAFQLLDKDSDEAPELAGEPAESALPAAVTEVAVAENTPDEAEERRPVGKIGDPAFEGLRHYRVQSGDSLLTIARRFQVPVDELETLNELKEGNKLYPGLILFLPNREIRASRPAEIASLESNRQSGTHEPNNKRETPGTRVPLAVNDGYEPAPRAVVPASSWGPEVAVDEPGFAPPAAVPAVPAAAVVDDAAAELEMARVLAARERELAEAQAAAAELALSEPTPEPARVIEPAPAPAAAIAVTPPPARAAGGTPAATIRGVVKLYTVQPGDTAYALGRKFGIGHEKLLKLNGVADATKLKVGQKLKIPVAP